MASSLLAFVLAFAVVSQASPSLSIVSVPSNLHFNKNAGAAPIEALVDIFSASLGLPASSDIAFDAIESADVFSRPVAAVTIVFDSVNDIEVSAPVYFQLSQACGSASECVADAVSHKSSVASTVHSVFGCDAHTFSISADPVVAAQAASSCSHVVAMNAQGKYTDSKTALEVDFSFSNVRFGQGVTFNSAENSLEVLVDGKTVSLSLQTKEYTSFASEVAAILSSLEAIPVNAARVSPDAVTIVVSTLKSALQVTTCPKKRAALHLAAQNLISSVIALSQTLYGDRALVSVVQLPSTFEQPEPSYDSVWDWANVPYCSQYQCYCNADSTGAPWGDDGCSTSFNSSTQECIFYGCACSSPYVQLGSQECIACEPGLAIYNGWCYVDSIYPATFNIVLWLGLAIAIGLVATCYAIGGMDPGRNTAIYRTAHAKSH